MIRYTVQFIIAGYSSPSGDDIRHFSSLDTVRAALLREHHQAEQYGAGYTPSEAFIWCGQHDDVTDLYPDRRMITGPRGGVALTA